MDIDQRPRYVKRKFNIKSRVCNWNGIDSKKVFLDRKIVVYLWEFSITTYYGPYFSHMHRSKGEEQYIWHFQYRNADDEGAVSMQPYIGRS